MDVNVVGQPRILVALLNELVQFAEVIHTGNALHTGRTVKQLINLINAHSSGTMQVENNARIHVP